MVNRTNKLIRNTIILGFGQFLPKLVSLITLPILTAGLTTSEYGIYDLILSTQSLLIPLMTLQIQQAIFRKLIQKGDKYSKEIISSAYCFVITMFLIWCPLIIFIYYFVVGYAMPVVMVMYYIYIGNALFDVLGQTLRGIGFNLKYSIGIVIYSIINTLLLLLIFELEEINVLNVFLCSLIAYIIACVFYFFSGSIFSYIKLEYNNKAITRELLDYSIPMIPSSISLWIVNLSDRLLVTAFLGVGMNGIYSVANKIPNLFASVYAVFNLAWTETASRVMDKDADADEYYSSMFEYLFRFLSGAMILLISLSPLIFKVLINNKYDLAYSQMPVLFMGVFFNALVSFYGGLYVAKQQTKQVGYSSLAGAVLNIIINIIMIRRFGLYAASISTVLSFAIITVYRAFDIRKYIEMKYNVILIMRCILLMVIYCILCSNRNIMINSFLFLIAVVINIILNKKIIVLFIRRKQWGNK